jgi:hypothetical protein
LKGSLSTYMNNENPYDLVCTVICTKDTILSPSGVKYVDGDGINNSTNSADRGDEAANFIADIVVKIV